MTYNPEFSRKSIEPEWQDLVEEYPEIFLEPSEYVLECFNKYYVNREGNEHPKTLEELVNLRYGFECSIGWKEIIRDFCKSIRNLVNIAKSNGDKIVYKTCILKEKFGSLRDQGDFYGEDAKAYFPLYREISHELESKSGITCAKCGKPGMTRAGAYGWWQCRCEACMPKPLK